MSGLIRCALVGVLIWCQLAIVPGGEALDQIADPLREAQSERPADSAIPRALAWLRSQTAATGTVGTTHPYATTGLTLIAHLAAGQSFTGEHGPWLRGLVTTLIAKQLNSGSFAASDAGQMYTHGIIVQALAHALGAIGDPALEQRARSALTRAVAFTIMSASVAKSVQYAGGWHYSPLAVTSDLSVSGWQVQSLIAARSAGITIPDDVFRRASGYAASLVHDGGRVGYDRSGEDHPALRGSALCALEAPEGALRNPDPRAAAIRQRILGDAVGWGGKWLFYRAYTETQAREHDHTAIWAAHQLRIEALLCKHQAADGSWPVPPGSNEANLGPVYRTAVAVIALSAGRSALPISVP